MKIFSSVKDKKLVIERESKYFSISRHGRIMVTDEFESGTKIRLLLVNGTRESATYLVPGLRNEPVFEYIRTIAKLLGERYPHIRKALIIGGAGYAFPKFFISHYPDRSIDVVENNPEMVTIAKKYFFLDELYDTYDLYRNERLRTFVDDGMHYLENCTERYDLIINDAFVGNIADKGLASDAGAQAVYNCLSAGGVYLINAITARTGAGAMPGVMTQEVVSRVFGRAEMIPVRPSYPADKSQNVIICAEKKAD